MNAATAEVSFRNDARELDASEDLRDRTLQRTLAEHRATSNVIEQLSDATGLALSASRPSDALLAVVSVVAKRMNVEVRKQTLAAQEQDIDDIDAIARGSDLRTRRVTLPANWWQSDCGDLIGWTTSGQPVAILRTKRGYDLLNPADETVSRVDDSVAARLQSSAAVLFRPLPDDVNGVVGLARFAASGHGRSVVGIATLSICGTGLSMFSALATGTLVDHVIPHSDRVLAVHLMLALIVASVGHVLIQLAGGIGALRLQTLMTVRTQTAVWDRLLRLPVAFIRRYSTGDLSHRAMMVTTISSEITGSVVRSLITGMAALLNLGLMAFYSPRLAVVAAVMGLLWCCATTPLTFAIRRHAIKREILSGQLFGFVVQLLNGIARIRIGASEQRVFNEWGRRFTKHVELSNRIRGLSNASGLINLILSPLGTIVLFWFAAHMLTADSAAHATMSAGVFLAFYASFGMFLRGCTMTGEALVDVADSVAKFRTVAPLLSEPPESTSSKRMLGEIQGQIEFRNVSFSYDDGPVVVNNVNLDIQPGAFVALVGSSGSGKSTLLRLLLQFETPTSGSITLDGHDIAQLDMSSVRRQIGVVLQTNHIAAGSVFDNITMGCSATEEQVMEAAEDAGLAEDIQLMPMGIHTMVSENGSNLSGGQRQRLMIARALVRNPSLLLFDEATSALDNRTQSIVSESIARRGVTRLVIAHRLSTIRQAENIYVLDEGKIVQQGSYEQLAAYSGAFRSLMARQG
ncbi:MAG: NHLP bacteriocin export ABC transporter permease/ATPase subunit [Planctomycetota bacterium]